MSSAGSAFLTYMAVFSYTFSDEGVLEDVNDEEIIALARVQNSPGHGAVLNRDPGGFSTEKSTHSLMIGADRVLDQVEQVIRKGFWGLNRLWYIDRRCSGLS